jgi:hypothetical protein
MRKLLLAVILIIIINLCGILLKFYGLDRHLILLGFRFHISLLIPCVLLFQKNALTLMKKCLSEFSVRKFISVFLIAILPALILLGGLFLINGTELADPEYFYELGLSSIVDYPVYLIWNAPQIIILGFSLDLLTTGKRYKFPLALLLIAALFSFELVPAGKDAFSIHAILDFTIGAVLFSVFFSGINNVYYLAVYIFTVLWSHALLFGRSSKALVNMILAKNYNSWEGFFTVTVKSVSEYTFLIQAGISLILLLFMFVLNLNKNKLQPAETNNMGILNK